MADTVQISRGAFGALAGSLLLSLLALAFLLGRQSAPPPVAVASPPLAAAPQPNHPEGSLAVPSEQDTRSLRRASVAPAKAPPPPADREPASSPDRDSEDDLAWDDAPPRAAPPRTRKAPVRPAPSRSPSAASRTETAPKSRTEVQRYFQQIDEHLASAGGSGASGDPHQLATQALQSSLQGDPRQFQELARSAKSALQRIQAVTPPSDCQEHHSLLVAQLQQGLQLLEQVQQSTTTLDTSNLTALAARGQAMQAEVVRFQELDRRLRQGL